MLALQRQREILKMAERDGAVRVTDLAQRFSVTEETIRRDLTMMENAGRLKRSHGGAVLAQSERREMPHRQREIICRDEKIAIAREAVKRVNEGDTILMDASTSVLFMAHELPDRPLTVVTNSVLVVLALAEREHIRLLSVGGSFSPVSMSFLGPLAEKSFQEYHVNKLFFSCRGVDVQRGLSDPGEATAQLKQQMMKIADERILLADHGKFGVRALAVIAGLDTLSEIITDAEADEEMGEAVHAQGPRLTRVDMPRSTHPAQE